MYTGLYKSNRGITYCTPITENQIENEPETMIIGIIRGLHNESFMTLSTLCIAKNCSTVYGGHAGFPEYQQYPNRNV